MTLGMVHTILLRIVIIYCDYLGTKNVGKSLKKICKGTKKKQGVTWFPELVDKRKYAVYSGRQYLFYGAQYLEKSIKLHLYWAMKNCGGDAEVLRELVENIPSHYQVSTKTL